MEPQTPLPTTMSSYQNHSTTSTTRTGMTTPMSYNSHLSPQGSTMTPIMSNVSARYNLNSKKNQYHYQQQQQGQQHTKILPQQQQQPERRDEVEVVSSSMMNHQEGGEQRKGSRIPEPITTTTTTTPQRLQYPYQQQQQQQQQKTHTQQQQQTPYSSSSSDHNHHHHHHHNMKRPVELDDPFTRITNNNTADQSTMIRHNTQHHQHQHQHRSISPTKKFLAHIKTPPSNSSSSITTTTSISNNNNNKNATTSFPLEDSSGVHGISNGQQQQQQQQQQRGIVTPKTRNTTSTTNTNTNSSSHGYTTPLPGTNQNHTTTSTSTTTTKNNNSNTNHNNKPTLLSMPTKYYVFQKAIEEKMIVTTTSPPPTSQSTTTSTTTVLPPVSSSSSSSTNNKNHVTSGLGSTTKQLQQQHHQQQQQQQYHTFPPSSTHNDHQKQQQQQQQQSETPTTSNTTASTSHTTTTTTTQHHRPKPSSLVIEMNNHHPVVSSHENHHDYQHEHQQQQQQQEQQYNNTSTTTTFVPGSNSHHIGTHPTPTSPNKTTTTVLISAPKQMLPPPPPQQQQQTSTIILPLSPDSIATATRTMMMKQQQQQQQLQLQLHQQQHHEEETVSPMNRTPTNTKGGGGGIGNGGGDGYVTSRKQQKQQQRHHLQEEDADADTAVDHNHHEEYSLGNDTMTDDEYHYDMNKPVLREQVPVSPKKKNATTTTTTPKKNIVGVQQQTSPLSSSNHPYTLKPMKPGSPINNNNNVITNHTPKHIKKSFQNHRLLPPSQPIQQQQQTSAPTTTPTPAVAVAVASTTVKHKSMKETVSTYTPQTFTEEMNQSVYTFGTSTQQSMETFASRPNHHHHHSHNNNNIYKSLLGGGGDSITTATTNPYYPHHQYHRQYIAPSTTTGAAGASLSLFDTAVNHCGDIIMETATALVSVAAKTMDPLQQQSQHQQPQHQQNATTAQQIPPPHPTTSGTQPMDQQTNKNEPNKNMFLVKNQDDEKDNHKIKDQQGGGNGSEEVAAGGRGGIPLNLSDVTGMTQLTEKVLQNHYHNNQSTLGGGNSTVGGDNPCSTAFLLHMIEKMRHDHATESFQLKAELEEAKGKKTAYKSELKNTIVNQLQWLENRVMSPERLIIPTTTMIHHQSSHSTMDDNSSSGIGDHSSISEQQQQPTTTTIPTIQKDSNQKSREPYTDPNTMLEENPSQEGVEVTVDGSFQIQRIHQLEQLLSDTMEKHEKDRLQWYAALEDAAVASATGEQLSLKQKEQLIAIQTDAQNAIQTQRQQWKDKTKVLTELLELTEQQHRQEGSEWLNDKNKLLRKIDSLQSEKKEIATEFDKVLHDLQELTDDAEQAVQEAAVQKEQAEAALKLCNDFEEQASVALKEAEEFKDQAVKLLENNVELNQQIQSLQERIQSKESMVQERIQSHESMVQQYQKTIDQSNHELNEMKKTNDTLRLELQKAREHDTDETKELRTKISTLQIDKEQQQKQYDILCFELRDVKMEVNEARQLCTQYENQMDEEIICKTKEMNTIRDENIRLQTQIDQMIEQINQNQNELQNRIENHQNEINMNENERKMINTQVEQLNEQNNELQTLIEQMKNERSTLQNEHSNEIQHTHSTIQSYENEMKKIRNERDTFEQQVQYLNNELNQRTMDVQRVSDENEQELEVLHNEINQYQVQIEQYQVQIETIQESYNTVNERYETLQAEQTILKVEIDSLRDDMKLEKDSNQNLQIQLKSIDEEKKSMELEMVSIRGEIDFVTLKLKSLEDEKVVLLEQVDAAKVDTSNCRKEIDTMKNDLHHARTEMEVKKKELDDANEQVLKVKKEIKDIRAQAADFTEQALSSQKQCLKLQMNLAAAAAASSSSSPSPSYRLRQERVETYPMNNNNNNNSYHNNHHDMNSGMHLKEVDILSLGEEVVDSIDRTEEMEDHLDRAIAERDLYKQEAQYHGEQLVKMTTERNAQVQDILELQQRLDGLNKEYEQYRLDRMNVDMETTKKMEQLTADRDACQLTTQEALDKLNALEAEMDEIQEKWKEDTAKQLTSLLESQKDTYKNMTMDTQSLQKKIVTVETERDLYKKRSLEAAEAYRKVKTQLNELSNHADDEKVIVTDESEKEVREMLDRQQKLFFSNVSDTEAMELYKESIEKYSELQKRFKIFEIQRSHDRDNWKLQLEAALAESRKLCIEKKELETQLFKHQQQSRLFHDENQRMNLSSGNSIISNGNNSTGSSFDQISSSNNTSSEKDNERQTKELENQLRNVEYNTQQRYDDLINEYQNKVDDLERKLAKYKLIESSRPSSILHGLTQKNSTESDDSLSLSEGEVVLKQLYEQGSKESKTASFEDASIVNRRLFDENKELKNLLEHTRSLHEQSKFRLQQALAELENYKEELDFSKLNFTNNAQNTISNTIPTAYKDIMSQLNCQHDFFATSVDTLQEDIIGIKNKLNDETTDRDDKVHISFGLDKIQNTLSTVIDELKQDTDAINSYHQTIQTFIEQVNIKKQKDKNDAMYYLEKQKSITDEMSELRQFMASAVEKVAAGGSNNEHEPMAQELIMELQRKESALADAKRELDNIRDALDNERSRRETVECKNSALNAKVDAYSDELMHLQAANIRLLERMQGPDDDDPEISFYDEGEYGKSWEQRSREESSPLLDEALRLAEGFTDIVHGKGNTNPEPSAMEMLDSLDTMIDKQNKKGGRNTRFSMISTTTSATGGRNEVDNASILRSLRKYQKAPDYIDVIHSDSLVSDPSIKYAFSRPTTPGSARSQKSLLARRSSFHRSNMRQESPSKSGVDNNNYRPAPLQLLVESLYVRCEMLERERIQLMEITLDLLESARGADDVALHEAIDIARQKSTEEISNMREQTKMDQERLFHKLCNRCIQKGILTQDISSRTSTKTSIKSMKSTK